MQIKKIAKSNEGKRRGGGQGRAGQGVLNARSVYLYRDDYTAEERDSVSVSSESLTCLHSQLTLRHLSPI